MKSKSSSLFIYLLMPVFLFLTGMHASAESEPTLEETGKEMMNFYLAPTREAFERYQKNADALVEKMDTSKNGADALMAVGIARISQKYNWPITGVGKASEAARGILAGDTSLAKFVADDRQVDPFKLDVWWVSFFSTGDTQYLKKILIYAGEPLPEHDMNRMLIVGSAQWSFRSNCQQHKAVMDFAKAELDAATSPEKRKFLESCITARKDSKPE